MPTIRFPIVWFRLLCLSIALIQPRSLAAHEKTGEEIYKKQCASCHGVNGEGVKKVYAQPLIGDKSVKQLASYIAKSMPEDAPGTCVGADADKVASYIYDAFYSPAAQVRNKPPRIELSRLTVRQYRNSIADLIASFRTPGKWDEQRGLRGEYYSGRRMNPNQKSLERLDPEVNFDWKQESPQPGKMAAAEFSARWNGSVLAPETGLYEFIIRTDHATRLWLNDLNKPLIDAWVKSGNDTEFRGTIYLVGGRAYPLRLEFSKAKQGVDDSKKNPPKDVKPAFMKLEWKRPEAVIEPIAPRFLSPNRFPETYIVETPFPPDDRSMGWERGSTISKAWDQATTDAAIDVANYLVLKMDELAGTRPDAPDRIQKLKEFSYRFAERAFRRPLAENEKVAVVDRSFAITKDPETAIKRMALFVLKSPRFLYRELNGGTDGYDVAARLSFALWDSIPDPLLLEDAANGKLKTREDVLRQAERMVRDIRAHAKLRDFLLFWVKADQAADLAKDPKRFPGFDAAVISDLRSSLELFFDEVITSPSADFRELLLADTIYMNGRLAKFYGADLAGDAPFQKVKLKEGQPRSGIVTHPYLMARFAYVGTTSPIHRGVFLARGVLGMSLRPPQEAFTPLAEDLHPTLTTRERVALQTKPAACQACHQRINELGFTLEHWDAVGRYREKENQKPVDARGSYETRNGEQVTFNGAADLAKFLARSEEVHASFAEQLFHHLLKQPMRAYGETTKNDLRETFQRNDFNIRKLMVEMVALAALRGRDTKAMQGTPKN